MAAADPINPQRVAWELSPRLPERAIITSDSGSCANWYARDIRMRRGMMGSLSGGLASMGAAVPYAIAAKFAHPDRPVVALVGDGAMQMNNMAELITVAKYWSQWQNHQWICCVFNNQDLNQVTWEQRVMEGDPKFEASQNLPDVPYHRFAELIGLQGIFCDREDQVAAAWEQALAADRPVLLEFRTDPNAPPLPPHIKLEQAKAYASVLLHGDPTRPASSSRPPSRCSARSCQDTARTALKPPSAGGTGPALGLTVAAGGAEHLAGYVAGLGGRQQHVQRGDFGRLARAAHGRIAAEALQVLHGLPTADLQGRPERSGRHGVHPDAFVDQLLGQPLAEIGDCRLGQ